MTNAEVLALIKDKDIKNSISFYGKCDYSKYLKSLI